MPAAIRVALTALLLMFTASCAATRASIQLVSAQRAVQRAKDQNAQELAVYEYTMAIRHLEKAREEAGYSDYKISVTLARDAAEWADKAIIVIDKEGRDVNIDELPGETEARRSTPDLNMKLDELPEDRPALPPAPNLPQDDPDDSKDAQDTTEDEQDAVEEAQDPEKAIPEDLPIPTEPTDAVDDTPLTTTPEPPLPELPSGDNGGEL